MFMPDLKLEVAFNAGVRTPPASRVWTDISDYAELGEGITVVGGRADERSVSDPNRLSVVLDNKDGRFTPEKTGSPYYPNVKIGRPIRLRANLTTNGNGGRFLTDITGWTGSTCTVAWVSTPAQADGGAMSMTSTGAGDIFANDGSSGVNAHPVTPGELYSFEAWVRHGGVARDARVDLTWYDSGGAAISTVTPVNVTLTTTYQLLASVGQAPSNAAFARMRVRVLSCAGAGEVFYVDTAGTYVDRFTGFVDEWPVEWTEATDAYAAAVVTATSRTALLGEGQELGPLVSEEIAVEGPIAYYTMGEAEGATSASDTAGAGAPSLTRKGIGVNPAFGDARGPAKDSLTACKVGAAAVGSQAKWLQAQMPSTPAGDWTVEFFFLSDTTNGSQNVMMLGTRVKLTWDGTGHFRLSRTDGGGSSGSSSTRFDLSATHHVAVRYTAATTTFDLIVDGSIEATLVISDTKQTGMLYIGNAPDPTMSQAGNSQFGTVSSVFAHVAVHYTALTTGRCSVHYSAGVSGFNGDTINSRMTRYFSYAGLTTADFKADTGDTTLTFVDSTGKTVLDLLRTMEATDGGVLYDQRDGRVRYANKPSRYTAVSAFTLDAQTQQLDGQLRPVLDRTALLNDVTAKSVDGTISTRIKNQTSIVDYNKRALEIELSTTNAEVAFQTAADKVARFATPRLRVPSLAPIDVLMLDPATQAAVMGADVGTRFTVTNLPGQAPASSLDFYVEGWTDVFGLESWTRVFNVSPAALSEAWTLDSATRSQLDQTTTTGLEGTSPKDWATPKTWTAGEVVSSTELNQNIRENLSALVGFVNKAADQFATNVTTLFDDEDLSFDAVAGITYLVDVHLRIDSSVNAAGDFACGFTFPASSRAVALGHALDDALPSGNFDNLKATVDNSLASGTAFFRPGASTSLTAVWVHLLLTPTADGTVQFQWCQNTAVGTTTVRAGSFMTWEARS